ncbi:hypothetical protein C5167_021004 [Papaver somniferum]|uniref:Uncharacterized protein n=1 Tax=Papaver somniferum TaxID=3469 RepID=A0A4Y7IUP1_PAPSO|nr:hypothetical protein C5167_021004 [Papaver somniferum]
MVSGSTTTIVIIVDCQILVASLETQKLNYIQKNTSLQKKLKDTKLFVVNFQAFPKLHQQAHHALASSAY